MMAAPLHTEVGSAVMPSASPPTPFVVAASSPPVLLSFEDITYSVTVNGKPRNLLRNITGFVESGSVLAILGPSGSGKTTLLDVLAQRRRKGLIGGEVLLNGMPIDAALYRRQRGYVQQEDLFYSFLTVEETVRYAATLRTPPSVSKDAIDARVGRAIELLGIEHVQHCRIGNTLARGISGGEKKRCAVAAELVTAPSLLFLDEPTTGLDTFTALHLLSLLKSVARSGVAVVLSIHQPRASIYQLFDRVLLLNSVGEQAFFGPAAEAVPFFASLGIHSPLPQNPADFLLDAVSTLPLDSTDGTDESYRERRTLGVMMPSPTQGRDVAAAFSALRLPHIKEDMYSALYAVRQTDAREAVHSAAGHVRDGEDEDVSVPLLIGASSRSVTSSSAQTIAPSQRYYRGTWTQAYVVATRCILNTMRDPIATIVSVSVAVVFALLIGSIYYQVGDDQDAIRSRMGVLFFVMMNTTFSALGNLDAYLTGRALYSREHGNGMYSAAAYYVGKMVQDVPFGTLVNTAFNGVVYAMVGLQPTWYRFCVFNVVGVLVMLNSYALCLFVSNMAKNYATANITASLLLVLYLLPTGGMLVSLNKIPLVWRWIKYISFVRYAFAALVANEFTDLTLTCRVPGEEAPLYPCVTSGTAYAASLGFVEEDVPHHILFLAISVWVYLFLGYLVLRFWRSAQE